MLEQPALRHPLAPRVAGTSSRDGQGDVGWHHAWQVIYHSTLVHLLHPHPLLIPSLVSRGPKNHSQKKIHSLPKTTWHGGHRASGISMGFPSAWHAWDVCDEASPFEHAGRRWDSLMPGFDPPVFSDRERHQHQLLGRPQPPGSVLQDGRGVRQVHRVRQKVSSARGCRRGRRGCEGRGTVQAEAVHVFWGRISAWGLGSCPGPA